MSTSPFHFGAAWYPEWEPKDEWRRDLERMLESGLNTVRICEFSWEHFEPRQGEYHFDFYDEVLRRCGELGIWVVLGIDTVRPPLWLFERYPDIALVDQLGQPAPGSWPAHCFNHPAFGEVSAPFIERFVRRYCGSRSLVYYQLDNEPAYHYHGGHRGGQNVYCYCAHCQRKFAGWLSTRYPNGGGPRLASRIPEMDATGELLWLEWRRFHDETILRRVAWVAGEVKRHDPNHPVTTNIMVGSQFTPGASYASHDVYSLGRLLDVYGMDYYTDTRRDYCPTDAMIYSISDRLGGPKGYHCLETQPTTMAVPEGGWQNQDRGYSKHGDDRKLLAWGWRPMAFGARSLLYWVWRLQYRNVWAIARPDGTPTEFAAQTRRLAEGFGRVWPSVEGSLSPAAEAAIIHSRDVIHLAARQGFPEAPGDGVLGAFTACWRQRVLPDVLDEYGALHENLARYKVIFAPCLLIVSSPLVAALRRYVENGGILVWDARSASYFDEGAGLSEFSGGYQWKIAMGSVPAAGFDAVMGYRVLQQYGTEKPIARMEYPLGEMPSGSAFRGAIWWDECHALPGARVLATFDDGNPALIEHPFGKGRTLSFAVDFFRGVRDGARENELLLASLLFQAGVQPCARVTGVPVNSAEQLELVIRAKGSRWYLFAINANPRGVEPTIELPFSFRAARELLRGETFAKPTGSSIRLQLEPFAVAVVEFET